MSNYQGSVPDTATRPMDWLALAPCNTDPEAMFPGTDERGITQAKGFCARCSAVDTCLQWALDNREMHGVWGGLSEAERRTILRRRGIKTPAAIDEEPVAPRTFQSLYDERTVALTDGHLAWTGAVPVYCERAYHTPAQIVFRLDRGRTAEGIVRRTCGRDGCVLAAHLMDQRERNEARDRARTAAAV